MQFSFQFPPADDAPAQARGALEVFDQILAPEVLEDLQLVVTELITNSVKFGPSRSITLSLQVSPDGVVQGEVIDEGDGELARVEMTPEPSLEGGGCTSAPVSPAAGACTRGRRTCGSRSGRAGLDSAAGPGGAGRARRRARPQDRRGLAVLAPGPARLAGGRLGSALEVGDLVGLA